MSGDGDTSVVRTRPVAVVLVALAVLGSAVACSGGGSSPARQPGTPGAVVADHLSLSRGDDLLLPGEPGQPLDIAGLFYDSSSNTRSIGRARVGVRGLTWQAAALPKDVSSITMATDGRRVFVGSKAMVRTYDLKRGTSLWSARLSDEVDTSCRTCFTVVDGRLVVLTRDAYVHALDPATGAERWQRRLEATNGKLLLAGSQLVITDRDPAPGIGYVAVVDPATGKDVRRFAAPCRSYQLDAGTPAFFAPYDPIVPVPGTNDVVLVSSGGTSCIQRWDLTTGNQRWSRERTANGSIDESTLLVSGSLVMAPGSHEIEAYGLADGRPHLIALGRDEAAKPQAVAGGRLIAVVTQTRGTARPALVAYDPSTGRRAWAVRLDDKQAFSPPEARTTDVLYDSDPGRFLLAFEPDHLRLVTMARTGRALSVLTLDARSGGVRGKVDGTYLSRYDSESGSHSVGVERVRGSQLVITVDSLLQTIDLRTAAVTASWPPR
ncbi:MAG: serine/threonine protein kinase [Acidimicrobiales bacterium]|nr:serine/threonine protein kinase [Acidimicrobiales bacterium]